MAFKVSGEVRRHWSQGGSGVIIPAQPTLSPLEQSQQDRTTELELRKKRRSALARRSQLGVASLLSGGSQGLSDTLG